MEPNFKEYMRNKKFLRFKDKLSENDILNSGKFIAIRKILEECQKAVKYFKT